MLQRPISKLTFVALLAFACFHTLRGDFKNPEGKLLLIIVIALPAAFELRSWLLVSLIIGILHGLVSRPLIGGGDAAENARNHLLRLLTSPISGALIGVGLSLVMPRVTALIKKAAGWTGSTRTENS